MHSAASQPPTGRWLLNNGLKQLELLFRAIVYQPAEPILIADNDRNYQDASCGAAKLFGLPRGKIIGRRIDDFAEPSFRPDIGHLWRTFLERGEQQGTFRGAERIYGYQGKEIIGQSISCFYPGEDALGVNTQEELKRVAAQGHFGNQRWHIKKDAARFWANVLTMALRGESGALQGFARVVRDFSERHSAAAKLRRGGVFPRQRAEESTVAGFVSGEFDHISSMFSRRRVA